MADYETAYIPSSALDSFAHALYADVIPEIGTRNPHLLVKLKLNAKNVQYSCVQVVVTHYIRGEEKYKKFELEMKLCHVVAALKHMEHLSTKAHDGQKELVVWEVKAPKKVNGQMTKERITAGKLVVGRNDKGVFISVVHWNDKYPHIAFYPGMNDGMSIGNPAGDDAKRQYDYICANARGWGSTVSALLNSEYSAGIGKILDNLRKQQASGGGGNNNSGGGNSGGYGGGNNNNSNNNNHNNPNENTVDNYSSTGGEFNF